jgi:thiol peroxidase
MAGLLARTVIVADAEGIVRHVQITETIGQEPDYDGALAALR